jgi:hypothetical protein
LSSERPLLEYKVIETSVVTDEELQRLVNDWVGRGWSLDDIRFVLREASRRPAMAFIFFTRHRASGSFYEGQDGATEE